MDVYIWMYCMYVQNILQNVWRLSFMLYRSNNKPFVILNPTKSSISLYNYIFHYNNRFLFHLYRGKQALAFIYI